MEKNVNSICESFSIQLVFVLFFVQNIQQKIGKKEKMEEKGTKKCTKIMMFFVHFFDLFSYSVTVSDAFKVLLCNFSRSSIS